MRRTSLFIFLFLFCTFLSAYDSPGRFGHSSIALKNGTIVVFGGHDFISIDHNGKQFVGLKNDIWTVDPHNNGTWQQLNVIDDSNQPEPRAYHTATHKIDPADNVTELMVIFGGSIFLRYSGLRSTVFKSCGREDIWEFNFSTRNWTLIVPHLSRCNAGLVLSGNYGLFVLVVLVWYYFM